MKLEIITSAFVIVFVVLVMVGAVGFLVMEAGDKLDTLREKAPWFVKLIERRESLNVLLAVCLFMLLGNGYELIMKELPEIPAPPIVKLPPPLPPIIKESKSPVNQPRLAPITPAPIQSPQVIKSISIETRLTCELMDGAEIPPAEVSFIPVGTGSDATLTGNAGTSSLVFVSPVRFRRQDDNHIVVINRFASTNANDLTGRPIGMLKNFDTFVAPVEMVVYGRAFAKMNLYEVSVSINGADIWYYSYPLNDVLPAPGKAPILRIPLQELHKSLP